MFFSPQLVFLCFHDFSVERYKWVNRSKALSWPSTHCLDLTLCYSSARCSDMNQAMQQSGSNHYVGQVCVGSKLLVFGLVTPGIHVFNAPLMRALCSTRLNHTKPVTQGPRALWKGLEATREHQDTPPPVIGPRQPVIWPARLWQRKSPDSELVCSCLPR